jgi:phosphatidylglycerophosphate synthase
MTRPWVLVFDKPNGAPLRRVGGLSLALRLALDAQRAGATSVVCPEASTVLPGALADPRLQIPVVSEVPANVRTVHISASLLVHRDVFRSAAEREREDVVTLTTGNATVDVPYAFAPVDVLDARVAGRVESALFRSLRKPQDGWTSRHLNRYCSLAISRLLVKTSLTPNQVSVGILAIGLAGAFIATRGTYASLLLGAFLFQAQSVLDGCDGEMSRVTYRGSLLGEWLDTIGDDLTNYGFFAGAAIGLHAATGSKLYLAAGAVTVLCGVTASAIEYRYLLKIGSGDLLKYPASQATSEGSGPLAAIGPLFKRDTFVFLTLLAAAASLLGPMLVVFSIAAVGILGNVLATEARMAKERREGGDA